MILQEFYMVHPNDERTRYYFSDIKKANETAQKENMERQYAIKSTGYSSDRYGKCEVCHEHASEVFMRRGEGGDKPILQTFGHKECLEKAAFPGICYLCGLPIYVGDDIQRWTVEGTPVAAHVICVVQNTATGRAR